MTHETESDELPLRRLLQVMYWIVILVCIGTVGYRLVEGWRLLDCFYMTVITVSTVGYGEAKVLSDNGRYFTSLLIFVSLVSMTGWTAILTSFIVECDLGGHFQRRRTARMVADMKDHTIVCGSGLLAQAVVEELIRKRTAVVMIAPESPELQAIQQRFRRLQVIQGNPANELTLARANLLNARHVVAATESEVENLLIGITCKDIGDGISVIAECNDRSIANRMRKSGIDEVISPSQLAGLRATSMILG